MDKHMDMGMHRHMAGFLIILGVIIIANELYFNVSWWILLGLLLILKGIKVLFWQGKCCEGKKKCC
jgi:hypothetical protein